MTIPVWLVAVAAALAPFTVIGVIVTVRAVVVAVALGTHIIGGGDDAAR